jgi:hypothetical protein
MNDQMARSNANGAPGQILGLSHGSSFKVELQ